MRHKIVLGKDTTNTSFVEVTSEEQEEAKALHEKRLEEEATVAKRFSEVFPKRRHAVGFRGVAQLLGVAIGIPPSNHGTLEHWVLLASVANSSCDRNSKP